MNKSFYSKSVMGILVLMALTMSACAKKDEGSSIRSAGRTINTPGVNQGQNNNTCANPNMAWGKIFDPAGSYNFESQVKGFVSATLDPQSLGTISGDINSKSGIDFNASFQFDSSGKLVPESSAVTIKIFDSLVNQSYNGQIIQPYVIQFSQASSGMIDRNTRQIQVTFEDNYGTIVFQGQYDNSATSVVQGTVYYQNKTAVSGYQPASGTLGAFRAYACAMIK